jgi:hypothetical protein
VYMCVCVCVYRGSESAHLFLWNSVWIFFLLRLPDVLRPNFPILYCQ